jgi:hypothetical protein
MKLKSVLAYAFALSLTLSFQSHHAFGDGAGVDPDADYDRLDGTGKSGKTVNVIEWEDNLEIHISPKGSTAGLGMKIDDTKGNKVMVIAYRFVESPKTVLTRRAILGIPLVGNFKVYKDPTENDYDKFIISNNGLSGQVVAFKLDPTPTQLYPDGYAVAKAKQQGSGNRAPASVTQDSSTGMDAGGTSNAPAPPQVDDNGTVGTFFSNDAQGNNTNGPRLGRGSKGN